MKYYLAVKRMKEILIHTTWINLKNIMLIERRQLPKNHILFRSYEMSAIGKFIETESRSKVAEDGVEGRTKDNS